MSKGTQTIVHIKELDPDVVPPQTKDYMNAGSNTGSKIVVIGKPGTGKSTLIKALLYSKRHIFPCGIAMSGTEDSNHDYSKFMPDTFVYNQYDEAVVKSFIDRQKIAKEHLPNPWAVIVIDDCTEDPKIFNSSVQQALYKLGRHWKLMYLLSLQYPMDAKPYQRTATDCVFILREPIEKNRESIYKNYASIIPSYEIFCELMNVLTEDRTALVILNSTTTNRWEDCVFYWKAPLVPADWKLGNEIYWDHHRQRYNQDYVNAIAI